MSISLRPILKIGSRIRQTLLAQDCLLCQAASGEQLLCEACESELPSNASSCPRCALGGPGNAECGACIADPPHYDASCAAFIYAYPVDALIQALKYGGQLALAGLFARKLYRRVGTAAGVDLIVPLPLHPARLAERGFNQALLLARPVASSLGVPLLRDAVVKDRLSAAQAGLAREERLRNLHGAFRARRSFAGARVLVVDDVMTSGATLAEMALALRAAGAVRIENLVVARTAAR